MENINAKPILIPFGVLIGNWEMTGTHPLSPDTTFHGHASFEWVEGGAYLMMRSDFDEPDIPSSISVFGSDDIAEEYFVLYYDERGVSRKYGVSLRDDLLKWWRNMPDFSQRFTGVFMDDGRTTHS